MKNLSDEQFIQALHHEDELGSVIRAHLHIENMLEQLLALQIPIPDRLKEMELTYKDKVLLSLAMGLNEEFKSSLIAIGEIRNKFAHQPDFKLEKHATTSLYKTFASSEKELINTCISSVFHEDGAEIRFKSLNAKEQFIIIAVAMRQILLASVNKWKSFL